MPSKEFSFCDATSLSTLINKSPYSWWQLPIEVRHDNHRRKFDSQLVSDIYRVFAYVTIFFFDLFLFLVDERRDEWRFHTTPAWNEKLETVTLALNCFIWPRQRFGENAGIFMSSSFYFSAVLEVRSLNTQLYWLRGAKRARINAQYPLRWIWANRIAILWFLMKIAKTF
jgi:hypothetical protein